MTENKRNPRDSNNQNPTNQNPTNQNDHKGHKDRNGREAGNRVSHNSISSRQIFQSHSFRVGAILIALSVVLTLLGRMPAFADWYTVHIYRHAAAVLGRISDRIPFLLGEILMYAAAVAVLVLIVAAVVFVIRCILRHGRRRDGLQRFLGKYARILALVLCIVIFIYTVLWTIPYHTTELTFGTDAEQEYTIEDIVSLRNRMTAELNERIDRVERDADGYPVEPENVDELARQAVLALGEEFDTIGTYAPEGKKALCSMFLKWMDIGGFTFPYTQEILLNKYVNAFYYPSLYAHELAHHLGFYRENEGVFISWLALINSDNTFLQYSACYTAWCYVQNAYLENLSTLPEGEQKEIRADEVSVNSQVFTDYDYYDGLLEEVYEEEVSETTESTFSGVSESIADVGWNVQDDLLAEASYDNVVELLLRYYEES